MRAAAERKPPPRPVPSVEQRQMAAKLAALEQKVKRLEFDLDAAFDRIEALARDGR